MASFSTSRSFAAVGAFALASQPQHVLGKYEFKSLTSGKCLDTPGSVGYIGDKLWIWDCLGGTPDRWYFSEDQKLVWGGDSRDFECAEVQDNDNNGQHVKIQTCGESDLQTWTFNQDTGVVSLGDADHETKCLQSSGTKNGDFVEISDCNGEDRQRWSFGPVPTPPPAIHTTPFPMAPTQIRSVQSNMCIDLPGGDSTDGTTLWMWDCNLGEEHQHWSFESDNGQHGSFGNVLRYTTFQNKCVDIDWDPQDVITPDSGTRIQIWDCNGLENQRLQFNETDGSIRVFGVPGVPQCVQIGGVNKGDSIVTQTCTGARNQAWTVSSTATTTTTAGVVVM